MSHSKLILKNDRGIVKRAPIGYSWTTLFFGWFVPIIRMDVKNFLIMFVIWVMTCVFIFLEEQYPGDGFFATSSLLLMAVSFLIIPFIYNRMYLHDLLSNGYEIVGKRSRYTIRELEQMIGVEAPNVIDPQREKDKRINIDNVDSFTAYD